jgi:type I restriction enzyme M protein
MQVAKASNGIDRPIDNSMEDAENLRDPDVLAAEIAENLQAALGQFDGIYEDLQEE